MFIDRRLLSQFDWPLLALGLLIPLCGLVVLYSAGYDPDSAAGAISWLPASIRSIAFEKQALFLVIGFLSLLVGLSCSPQFLSRYAYVVYSVCLVALIAVLLIGSVSNGSRRWINLGFVNLQPAETMKLGLILALARFLSKSPPRPGGYRLLQLVAPFSFFVFPMILIMRQPDLGSALSLGGIGFAMMLFMGIHTKSLLIMVLAVASALYPAWHALHPYQQRRVEVLFNPNIDPRGSGYHIIQSKIAVGSGQAFGKGYMNGTQTQLEFLPEHTTDFVFSVLAEEWGFVGCVAVLSLYFLFIFRLLRVVSRSKDLFAALVVFGIGSWFFLHVTINIGMVVGILPVVGIPLPLFSYGGSAVLSSMFSIGLALGFGMRRLYYVGRS
ncbi:MAG: rod shape-determining protein RodA [Deltaproteobacteria bacterium]|nr:rod shape-determining protein RodA [Deltaproteobacteria bacterium]